MLNGTDIYSDYSSAYIDGKLKMIGDELNSIDNEMTELFDLQTKIREKTEKRRILIKNRLRAVFLLCFCGNLCYTEQNASKGGMRNVE